MEVHISVSDTNEQINCQPFFIPNCGTFNIRKGLYKTVNILVLTEYPVDSVSLSSVGKGEDTHLAHSPNELSQSHIISLKDLEINNELLYLHYLCP